MQKQISKIFNVPEHDVNIIVKDKVNNRAYTKFEINGLRRDFTIVHNNVEILFQGAKSFFKNNWSYYFVVDCEYGYLAYRLCKSGNPAYEAFIYGTLYPKAESVEENQKFVAGLIYEASILCDD